MEVVADAGHRERLTVRLGADIAVDPSAPGVARQRMVVAALSESTGPTSAGRPRPVALARTVV
ncbi:hypothetical protein [Saccharothrix deserti]|uniref:hypothetical protein n=1 Tax=Saccharothrix deserti TaxID=2593674 RepID=UPI00131E8233|nr:hypothetical protein [Saccharothrix deserti]